MVDTAMALGAKDKDRVEKEMKQVLDFEIQLANVSFVCLFYSYYSFFVSS